MSKKDYVTVATCIRVQTFERPAVHRPDEPTSRAIANALAVEFELDNPRFDRDAFMSACGFGRED